MRTFLSIIFLFSFSFAGVWTSETGDMHRMIYDVNGDGIVNEADWASMAGDAVSVGGFYPEDFFRRNNNFQVYYLLNSTPSDIVGFYSMDPIDSGSNICIITNENVTNLQYLVAYITPTNLPDLTDLLAGSYQVSIHAYKTPPGTVSLTLEFYVVSSNGTTKAEFESPFVGANLGTSWTTYNVVVTVPTNVPTLATDRLAVKIKAYVSSGSPKIFIATEGGNYSSFGGFVQEMEERDPLSLHLDGGTITGDLIIDKDTGSLTVKTFYLTNVGQPTYFWIADSGTGAGVEFVNNLGTILKLNHDTGLIDVQGINVQNGSITNVLLINGQTPVFGGGGSLQSNQTGITLRGNAYVADAISSIEWAVTGTLKKIFVHSDTAPIGTDLYFDIRNAGISIFSNTNAMPRVADGANNGYTSTFSNSSIIGGITYYHIDLKQVGSTTPGGGDLRLVMLYTVP